MAIGKSMFPLGSSFQLISGMKSRYNKLQEQLATGQRASNLAEMGSNRFFDLSMRSRISKIDGYAETMKAVKLRLEVLDMAVTRIDKIEQTQRTSVTPGSYGTGNINFNTTPTIARSRFDELMTLLNSEVGGRYLFAGSKIDQRPVVGSQAAIEGEGGRDGFRTVAGERRQADVGASGMGRLTVTMPATDAVTVTEDGDHPFGLKLSTLATSSSSVALTQPTGTPPDSLSVQFTGVPIEGETVTMTFTLPDGTTSTVTMSASTDPDAPGEFLIGADADETATNFAAKLTDTLKDVAGTELTAASSYAAAENFFNGHGDPVLRVGGPPFDSATTLVPGTDADTVIWYSGEDSADARKTVDAKVDDGTVVNYGVQANEEGLVRLVQTLAAMSVTTYPNNDPTSPGRFDAMAERQIERLSESHSNSAGSIGSISVELALAKTTMDYSKERQSTYSAHLQGMLSDIETIPPEEVSMEILALKTRLEASYETTSLVAQLSLVHYLP